MAKWLENIGESNARSVVTGFLDANGDASIPTTVHWRLVCPDDDDSVVTDWATATPVTSVGSDGYSTVCEATIAIIASSHEMVTELDQERRALIVAADKDTDDEWNEEFLYYVERRSGRS
jgi:hypothetical protein